jgi:hypothetical protein
MYRRKDSRIGFGRNGKSPMNMALPDMIKNATKRMIALVDGAIRQIRQTGLPDELALDSKAVWVSGALNPQK